MKLHFLNGSQAGESQDINPPGISVGRETDNDVCLLIGGVSRYHAKIEFIDDKWSIKDLGSTNGTKVNGTKIPGPTDLKPGDILTIGDQNLRFGDRETPLQAPSSLEPAPFPVIQPVPDASSTAAGPMDETVPPTPSPAASPENEKQGGLFAGLGFGGGDKKEEAAKKPDATAAELDKINLFGSGSAKTESGGNGDQPGGKKLFKSNLVFYALVISAAIVFVAIFIKFNQSSGNSRPSGVTSTSGLSKPDKLPLMVHYVREEVSDNNVFRFSMTLEDGQATFTFDDLATGQSYEKTKPARELAADTLADAITETGFMKLKNQEPDPSSDGTQETRTLTVALNDEFNSVQERNTKPRSSFADVEHAIIDFAEDHNIPVGPETAEERLKRAEKAFRKAETLFANYQAKPENLRDAIVRYEDAAECLEVFKPKPEMYHEAKKQFKEASKILDSRIDDLEFDYRRSMQLRDAAKVRDVLRELCAVVGENHPNYKKYHKQLIKFEQHLKQGKK